MDKCTFSAVTQKYLECYDNILDTMISSMNSAKENDSVSYNFIVEMIPHHCGAIRLSEELLKYTTCIPLQELATGIIKGQTKGIEEMRNILCGCGKYRNDMQSLCGYRRQYGVVVQNMFSRMKSACPDNDINISYIRQMIPHHEGGIAMSRNALRFNICPQLKPMLNEMIEAQVNGIEEMKKILGCYSE
ncbi:MAG: DUF305 domain-containing protein [Ruminiclostridium sp.]|nr:DUF305 domain-containing protein [Ruminiclostridium sp.]